MTERKLHRPECDKQWSAPGVRCDCDAAPAPAAEPPQDVAGLTQIGDESYNVPAILRQLQREYDGMMGGSERNLIALLMRFVRNAADELAAMAEREARTWRLYGEADADRQLLRGEIQRREGLYTDAMILLNVNREDAERYRYIAEHGMARALIPLNSRYGSKSELDAAIDAARGKGGAGGE